MKTTSIMKVYFPLAQEDLSRFGVEIVKKDDGSYALACTFLVKSMQPVEAAKEAKLSLKGLTLAPERITLHVEETQRESSDSSITEKTMRIADMEVGVDNYV